MALVVPTRNEAATAASHLARILAHLDETFADFEVVVSDYSEDATPEIVKELARRQPKVVFCRAPERGIGAGLRAGLARTTKDVVMFYPIDLAWALNTIERSVDALEGGAGVVIGSRWCPGASTQRSIRRNLYSRVYNGIVRLFFGLRVKDTQGTFAIRRADLDAFRGDLESASPFLQTELLLQAHARRLAVVEIPCNVVETRDRSNVSLSRDGTRMAAKLLSFWWRHRVRGRAGLPVS